MLIETAKNLPQKDIDKIADLHFKVLEESFINNFGIKFLKIAYKSILRNKNNIVLTVRDKKKIVGILVAAKNSKLFDFSVIKEEFFPLIGEVIKACFQRPELLVKLSHWFFSIYLFEKKIPELRFIALSPEYQNKGLGSKLISKLNKIFEEQGITQYQVATKKDNKKSNRFYKKLGFVFFKSKSFFGDKFNYYLSQKSAAERAAHIFSYTRLLVIILLIFFTLFAIRSNLNMVSVPFHDFDEAHRAENAKQMRNYKSYFVPLTGSSQDRVIRLRQPIKDDPKGFLYYHLERPFLVYLAMIASTSVFGENEWAYRLPSYLFGIAIILLFIIFVKAWGEKFSFLAFSAGFLALITSKDLWLSSQSAMLDSTLTFFLFLSISALLLFCRTKKKIYLALSGISFALAVLSKGQFAIIFSLPLILLLFTKKLSVKDTFSFIKYAIIILLPWFLYLVYRFGIVDVVTIFSGFALYFATTPDVHTVAPFWWYIRWFFESFRPGWSLFLALIFIDILKRNINWEKSALLAYILGGLLVFSLPDNKLWWYTLPLIPAITLYIFLSLKDYLSRGENSLNLALVLLVASAPFFLRTSNKFSLIYGLATTILLIFILLKKGVGVRLNNRLYNSLVVLIFSLSLLFFYVGFPNIIPYHRNTKSVAHYYKNLPGKKCLWAYNMPVEAALFYSNAGEIEVYNENSNFYGHCKHYLMTPEQLPEKLNKGVVIYQRGRMRLIELP